MPEWLAVVVLGVVEGITEFLPVSSTGHLLLVENSRLLPAQSELFNVVIQAGAVLAVFLVFSRRVKELALRLHDRETRDYLLKLALAFAITAVGGLAAKKAGFALPKDTWPVAWATLVGGVLILVIERSVRRRPLGTRITWTIAVAVGLAQLLAAVFPGTSRSGATILAALLLGLNRPVATEFSFIVGIPTMLAAGGLKIFKALHHPLPGTPSEHWKLVLLGTLVSAAVSFVAVRWLLRYVQTHTFNAFGWYRIALGLVLFALLWR